MKDDSKEILFQSFLQKTIYSSPGMDTDIQPAFPLPATVLPILQDALKDDFGEEVIAHFVI